MWIISMSTFEAIRWALPEEWLQSHPALFPTAEELDFDGQRHLEKNWVPIVYGNEMLVSYSISPQIILKRRPDTKLQQFGGTRFRSACLGFIPDMLNINQATPWIPLKGCQRHSMSCGNATQKYYMSIFHTRLHGVTNFVNYVGIWNFDEPFELLGVIRINPVIFMHTQRFVYVSSMALAENNEDLGYLDSEVLIGYGMGDSMGLLVKVQVAELLGPIIASQLESNHVMPCGSESAA